MKDNILDSLLQLIDLTDRSIVIKLTEAEQTALDEYLELDLYNAVELQVMRNMFIILISHEIEKATEIDDTKSIQIWSSWVTVLTSMIDREIIRKGGQV